MTEQDAVDRVRRGAALLDREVPGWAERIKINELDIASTCSCVIGQLEGNFAQYERYGLSGLTTWWYGFDISHLDADDEYGAGWKSEGYRRLRRAWEVEIAKRVAPVVAWNERTADCELEPV